jgi:uncharacterized Zn-binding protein involved in type VI secretion
MNQAKSNTIKFSGNLVASNELPVGMLRSTHYVITCVRDGKVIWVDEFDNLVTIVGLNDSLDKHFKASAYTSAWFVGLASATPTFAAGDNMTTHGGWTEVPNYTEANRPALTLGTIITGSVDNSANKAVFTITGTVTVGGAFIVNAGTKYYTSGTLYGGGAFTGGNRALLANDVLNVTATLTAASA